MTRQEAIAECKWLAEQSKQLADAFRPSARDGAVIPVPAAMCTQLCNLLELMSANMEKCIDVMDDKEAGFER